MWDLVGHTRTCRTWWDIPGLAGLGGTYQDLWDLVGHARTFWTLWDIPGLPGHGGTYQKSGHALPPGFVGLTYVVKQGLHSRLSLGSEHLHSTIHILIDAFCYHNTILQEFCTTGFNKKKSGGPKKYDCNCMTRVTIYLAASTSA